MDISVIIVNYNTYKLTSGCIESIFKHSSDVTFEVIVVDNASSDNSIELLSLDNRISLIKSSANLGFGKANNLGLKYAKGKYIFLLNSDTILLNNALKIFYDFAELSQENIACMGSILLNTSKQKIHSFSQFPSILTILKFFLNMYFSLFGLKLFNEYEVTKSNAKTPFFVDYITGADLFIKRNIINQLGFFDPDFFMYFEETELQLRYKKARYFSVIIEGPSIIHLEGASNKKVNNRSFSQRMMFTKSMFIYMRRKYNLFSYIMFRLIYLMIIPSILFSGFSFKEKIKLLKQILFL